MILTMTWTNPTPHPGCGYRALYRRKGDASYTTILTSGSTSGTTSVVTFPAAPASYEGYIQSDCCGSVSVGDPWGENAYQPISVVITRDAGTQKFLATMTSAYANPYDTLISGTFYDGSTTIPFNNLTYPAGSTSATELFGSAPGVVTISALVLSVISPVFGNGGTLQQYDPILTPQYFEFIGTSGQTSGTTLWNGNPSVLPSFTLDNFQPTEVDVYGNVTAGDLIVSWAQGYTYGGGVSPYDYGILEIRQDDGSSTILASTTFTATTHGLRTITLSMVKGTFNITTSVAYKMDFKWFDDILVASRSFYLPSF